MSVDRGDLERWQKVRAKLTEEQAGRIDSLVSTMRYCLKYADGRIWLGIAANTALACELYDVSWMDDPEPSDVRRAYERGQANPLVQYVEGVQGADKDIQDWNVWVRTGPKGSGRMMVMSYGNARTLRELLVAMDIPCPRCGRADSCTATTCLEPVEEVR